MNVYAMYVSFCNCVVVVTECELVYMMCVVITLFSCV